MPQVGQPLILKRLLSEVVTVNIFIHGGVISNTVRINSTDKNLCEG